MIVCFSDPGQSVALHSLLIYTQKTKETLQRKEKNYGLLLVEETANSKD